jgi:hypothetical protein
MTNPTTTARLLFVRKSTTRIKTENEKQKVEEVTIFKSKTMEKIFNEIRTEREKQEAKWGEQNHPILDPILIDRGAPRMCWEYGIPSESLARRMVEIHAERGDLTYMHILIEEISEAASCGSNTEELRKELIQSASVLVAMIESLDRNGR